MRTPLSAGGGDAVTGAWRIGGDAVGVTLRIGGIGRSAVRDREIVGASMPSPVPGNDACWASHALHEISESTIARCV
jgi:hypothetical protein